MKSEKIVDKNIGMQLVGLLAFLLGLGLLFIFPIGSIVGLILMVAGGRAGYSKKNGWKCPVCKYSFTVD